jgi:hypothetical protein
VSSILCILCMSCIKLMYNEKVMAGCPLVPPKFGFGLCWSSMPPSLHVGRIKFIIFLKTDNCIKNEYMT